MEKEVIQVLGDISFMKDCWLTVVNISAVDQNSLSNHRTRFIKRMVRIHTRLVPFVFREKSPTYSQHVVSVLQHTGIAFTNLICASDYQDILKFSRILSLCNLIENIPTKKNVYVDKATGVSLPGSIMITLSLNISSFCPLSCFLSRLLITWVINALVSVLNAYQVWQRLVC